MDLSTLKIKNIRDTYGGAVWCMSMSKTSAIIATGSEDGVVRFFQYNEKVLEYLKSFASCGACVHSIAFHPLENILFCGCNDGTIRCFDTVY